MGRSVSGLRGYGVVSVTANLHSPDNSVQDYRGPDRVVAPPVSGLRGEHVLEIRPGFPIFRLEEASLEGLTRLMTLEGDIFGEETVDEWYMVSHIHHGNVMILVDMATKHAAGIAILMRDWDELEKCYLADFGIRAEYRGRGLGSAFLSKIVDLVKEEGFTKMSLTVDTSNAAAIGLYKKHGFKIISERHDLYGPGRDRYIMEFDWSTSRSAGARHP